MKAAAAWALVLAILATGGCGAPTIRAAPGGEAAERARLAQRVDALVRENQELRQQLRAMGQENEDLRGRIEKLKELDRELDRLRKNVR